MAGSQRPVSASVSAPIRNEDIVTRQNEACHTPPALRCPRAVVKTLASLPPPCLTSTRWFLREGKSPGQQLKALRSTCQNVSLQLAAGTGLPLGARHRPPVPARSCAGCGSGPAPELQQARDLPPRERALAASTAAGSEAPQDRGGTYLAQPFKQAFCIASTIYRRNSCASSWFPKRKCRAISREREKHQTSRDELTPSPPSPTAVCSSATPAVPGGQQQVREPRAQQEPCVPTPSARGGGFLRRPEGPHCASSTGRHGCCTSAGTKGGKASVS